MYIRSLVLPILVIFMCLTACQAATTQPTASPSPRQPTATLVASDTPGPTDTPIPSHTPTWSLPNPTQPATPTAMPGLGLSIAPDSLRALADARSIYIGAAANNNLSSEADYAAVLAGQFNLLTPENVMKFEVIHPEPDSYNFAPADELVNFAQANNMAVRGHTLVWHQQMPRWLKYGDLTPEQVEAVLRQHIATVVGRYRGQIAVWDVVNEAIADGRTGKLRPGFWTDELGEGYIDLAFTLAHEADPEALLFYNDYLADGLNEKSDGVYNLVKGMVKRGIPIDGVGMQFHYELGKLPPLDEVAANMQRLGELGLQVHITELDIRIADPATPAQLEQQAQEYAALLQVCLEAENCTAFITWGFTDKYSWIPSFNEGYGTALLFDAAYQPKPAFFALQETLK